MKTYWGKSVREGIAFGKTFLFERGFTDIVKEVVTYPQAEVERLELAVKETVLELQDLCEKAKELVGDENAAIFEMQKLIAMDDLLIDEVKEYILKHSCNGEYALSCVANEYAGKFALLEDEILRAKSADCLDVLRRMLKHMTGVDTKEPAFTKPVILLAGDLSPSETVNLDKEKILAIVLREGSEYSHMAILAKSMGIPCLVQTQVPSFVDVQNKEAIVDGEEGIFYVDPTDQTEKQLREKQKRLLTQKESLSGLIGMENRTKDGRKIELLANIGTAEEVQEVLEFDAGGIGLFRTEFLYLSRNIYPEEEEQFSVYRDVVEKMNPKQVIIRTLDIGADKKVPYLPFAKEENPALGLRGIRYCLEHKHLFLTQLKAILRASAYGKVGVMIPMVASVWEVQEVKKMLDEARKQLDEQQKEYGNPTLGIMIETPAAVMIADELAKEVDFFSIGTNDLIQYTLAADRMNPAMSVYTDSHHSAIRKMIKMTVESAHKAKTTVGICGELAADDSMAEFFLQVGVDELSVPAKEILALRKKIRDLDCTRRNG